MRSKEKRIEQRIRKNEKHSKRMELNQTLRQLILSDCIGYWKIFVTVIPDIYNKFEDKLEVLG